MSKARNIADLGSNDVLDTHTNGVTVTGSLTADGLTVETTADNGAVIEAHDNLTTTYPLKVQNAAGSGRLEIGTYGINNNIDLKIQTADTNRINVDTNGDITMYKDDGTTAGVTFDASSGWMGIGTSSTPNRNLEIVDLDTSRTQVDLGLKTVTNGTSAIFFADTDDTNIGGIRYFHSSNDLEFRTNDSEAMRMTSDGKLKLRTSDNLGNINTHPTYNTEGAYINGFVNGGGAGPYPRYLDLAAVGDSSWGGIIRFLSNDNSNNTAVERMRLDAAGNLGINKQSPAVPLDVTGTVQASGRYLVASGSVTSGYQFSGDGDTGMYQSSVNNISFSTANTHRITIGSTGKVGIGDTATNPVSRLEVRDANGSGDFVGATITNTAGSNAIAGVAFKGYDWVQGGIYHHRGGSALTLATNPNTSDLTVGGLVPRLNINNAGYVTMPYQPAFMAQRTGGSSDPGASTVYPFNTTYYNIGNGYNTSNYRFTAPVAGLYMFGVQLLTDASGGRQIIYLRINGSNDYNNTQGYEGSADSEEYNNVQINALIKLNANDYIDVQTGSSTNNNLYTSANGQNKFWGVLIA